MGPPEVPCCWCKIPTRHPRGSCAACRELLRIEVKAEIAEYERAGRVTRNPEPADRAEFDRIWKKFDEAMLAWLRTGKFGGGEPYGTA